MILLRRVIGDALRARRQAQRRTLREVSTAANVSLGYLSEIERGQKEPSSELLAAVCEALGARLSEILSEVSRTVEGTERVAGAPVPRPAQSVQPLQPAQADQPLPPAPERVAAQGGAVHDEAPEQRIDAAWCDSGLVVAPEPRRHGRPPTRPAEGPAPGSARSRIVDGNISVTVRQNSPLRATLRATRKVRREELLTSV